MCCRAVQQKCIQQNCNGWWKTSLIYRHRVDSCQPELAMICIHILYSPPANAQTGVSMAKIVRPSQLRVPPTDPCAAKAPYGGGANLPAAPACSPGARMGAVPAAAGPLCSTRPPRAGGSLIQLHYTDCLQGSAKGQRLSETPCLLLVSRALSERKLGTSIVQRRSRQILCWQATPYGQDCKQHSTAALLQRARRVQATQYRC